MWGLLGTKVWETSWISVDVRSIHACITNPSSCFTVISEVSGGRRLECRVVHILGSLHECTSCWKVATFSSISHHFRVLSVGLLVLLWSLEKANSFLWIINSESFVIITISPLLTIWVEAGASCIRLVFEYNKLAVYFPTNRRLGLRLNGRLAIFDSRLIKNI